MTLKYGYSKTGKRKESKCTELQQLSQKENFAIFLLKGRSTHMLRGVVSPYLVEQLEYYTQWAIQEIKDAQHHRKQMKQQQQKTNRKEQSDG